MATLTHDAQDHLERYLRQVRAALQGHSSVDPGEVERDVLGHIDAELSGEPEPVGAGSLRAVLERLGAPNQWVPAEDLPSWRRALNTLRSGPEDWRLAYLSFALFFAGLILFLRMILWPLPPLMMIASFLMARASVRLFAEHDEPIGARGPLIYPALIAWYIGLSGLLLFWPVPVALDAVSGFPEIRERLLRFLPEAFWLPPAAALLALGLWWFSMGLLLLRLKGVVRVAFYPFTEWFDRRHATLIALAGLVLVAISVAIVMAVRTGL